MTDKITLQDIYEAVLTPTDKNRDLHGFIKAVTGDFRSFEDGGYAALDATRRGGNDLSKISVSDEFQAIYEKYLTLNPEEREVFAKNAVHAARYSYDFEKTNGLDPETLGQNVVEAIMEKDKYDALIQQKNYSYVDLLGYSIGYRTSQHKISLDPELANGEIRMSEIIERERATNPAVDEYYIRAERQKFPPIERIDGIQIQELKSLGENIRVTEGNIDKGERAPDGIRKVSADTPIKQ